jgi:hypothetical protein
LQEFAIMMRQHNLKDFLFGLITDALFHQDLQEMVAVFKACAAGEVEWARFGMKLGELFHTILSHVPKPKNTTVMFATDDPWLVQIHDILKGFFKGLHRDGSELINKIKDPTDYIQRDTLYNFISALGAIKENPRDVTRYVAAFEKASVLLTEMQKVLEVVGEFGYSQKLQELLLMLRTGNIKDMVFPLLTDALFFQDIQEVVAVFKSCQQGETEWARFGTKLGELIHTILSHVPKPKMMAMLFGVEDHWAVQIHDIMKGFFTGLRRNGSDLVDHVKDLTEFIQRETLYNLITAIQTALQDPRDVSRFVDVLQKGSVFLTEIQKVVEAAGDIADSEKLKQFAKMIVSGNVKDFILGLLTDVHFHQDIQEVLGVLKLCVSGDAAWPQFGLKLGELFYTIFSHVPKL